MANLINEAEIRATWAPIIESATGINDSNKLAWMSEYCHNHKLYEEATLSSVLPSMVKGMGAVSFPSAFNTAGSAGDGSGDKSPSLLPLAMQVAAQTVGLDLVPVVPMAGPMGLLSYLDFVYDGGAKRDDAKLANVYYFSTDSGTGADIAGGATHAAYEFVGTSRIDGNDIYKVIGTALIDANVQADFRLAVAVPAATVELVKALEDHIPGFSASNAAGDPFKREDGERKAENIMGLSLFSKSVAAETFQVAAAVTREQVQDLKQFGVDAVAQVEAVLTNELTQSINNLILREMKVLGYRNVKSVFPAAPLNVLGNSTGFDLKLPAAADLAGGETVASVHRRLLSQILAAANLIANRGRRGAGNFAVVGPQTATVLQAVAGFVANPMANTISQAAGAIYPVGSVAGINVYTDPRKAWDDYTVVVGRKGDGNSPGLVFMPYLMAESVQTIAEGTMAPKIAVKSRFALVEAGFHPETQYVSFEVTNDAAGATWSNLLNLA
jgi:hypothetical protein